MVSLEGVDDLSHGRHTFVFSYLRPMNGVQLHFLLNHVPLFFTLFGLLILLTSLVLKARGARRYALLIWILGAMGSLGAMATGEEAEEVAIQWGMSHQAIHEHQESAELAHFACIGLGLLSLVLVVFEIRSIAWWKGTVLLLVFLSLGVLVMMSWAAHEGGKLRHPELYQSPPVDQPLPEVPSEGETDVD
jgi:hypothetical protein